MTTQETELEIAVILPAAGTGTRFAASVGGDLEPDARSKLEHSLAGQPVFMHAAKLFLNRTDVGQIIIAVNPDDIEAFRFRWGDKLGIHGIKIIAGGKTERWETVLLALDAVPETCTHVAIHDAARPLASHGLIDRLFQAARYFPAVIPGIPVTSTLKQVAKDLTDLPTAPDVADAILGTDDTPQLRLSRVVKTVERAGLVQVQTPQVFEINLLKRAYAQITGTALDVATRESITDDAMLVELLGELVHVVEGESTNLKITHHDDLALAQAWLSMSRRAQSASLGPKRLFADDEDD